MNKSSDNFKATPYLKESEILWRWYNDLSEDSRGFKSHDGEWSVNDVFRHFMLIEDMLIEQVEGRLASGKVKRAEWKHRRNAILLLAALWIPKRYEAPKAVSKAIELEKFLMEDWINLRKRLITLLEEFPSEHENGLVFKHPLAGPIRMKDAMRFLRFHMRHHYPQLRSLAKRGGFIGF
jgi:hypothetical protein